MLPIPLNPQFRIIAAHCTLIKGHWSGISQKDGFCRFYYPVGGSGRLKIENREMTLKEGHIYLIPAETLFQLLPSDGMEHYWFHFLAYFDSGMNLFSLFRLKSFDRKLSDIEISREEMDESMLFMLNSYRDKGLESNIKLHAGLMNYICTFFREDNLECKMDFQEYQRFEPVLRYIRDNYMLSISLRELSEIVHLHPAYFSSLFKKNFGLSPVKYINKVRIDQAQLLLAETDLRINEISGRTGFSSEFYFSETFRHYTGMAPREFRRVWTGS